MNQMTRVILRGALGFGVGTVLPPLVLQSGTGQMFLLFGWLLIVAVPFGSGALAAAIAIPGLGFQPRGVLGFGFGFVLMWFMVLLTHISIQGGGSPSLAWGAMGCGIGFALAGAAGGIALSPALCLPGALAFGLAGAAGGLTSFIFAGQYMAWVIAGAGALAGALFNAVLAIRGRPHQNSAGPGSTPTVS